jgi:hypothetical protein
MKRETNLVLGSTGKTSRRIVAGLAARHLSVRHGFRSATPLLDWSGHIPRGGPCSKA